MKQYLTFIDLETTGIFEEGSVPDIIEIGAVRLSPGLATVDEFQTLVKTDKELPSFIAKFTGIQQKEVDKAPSLKEGLDKLSKFCYGENSLIVAWPLCYEIPLLQYHYAKVGYEKFPLDRRGLDLRTMAHFIMTHKGIQVDAYSLDEVSKYFNANVFIPRHRALNDAKTEFEVYRHLMELNRK